MTKPTPTQLFDVFSISLVQVDSAEDLAPRFMMRAPMAVIARVLAMHDSAVARVVEELASQPTSTVHHNRRGPWSLEKHTIQPAGLPLGTEIG